MIRNSRDVRVYEGNTCYCGTGRAEYDRYDLIMSRDMAWEVLQDLVRGLREGDQVISLRFYEDLGTEDPA